jgi:hypothetical protein
MVRINAHVSRRIGSSRLAECDKHNIKRRVDVQDICRNMKSKAIPLIYTRMHHMHDICGVGVLQN